VFLTLIGFLWLFYGFSIFFVLLCRTVSCLSWPLTHLGDLSKGRTRLQLRN
jgi:hypothetical protein